MRLAGKVAVVTGGGSGFGEGIANLFAREGARVVVADIDEAKAAEVAQSIVQAGGQARAVRADVSQGSDVEAMREVALAAFGDVGIVVNNAGTTHRNKPILEITEDEFDRVQAVNVKSLYWTARHFVPHFRQRGGGVFVNIASTAAIRPRPGLVWYNASKGAVVTASKAMAAELGPDNIRVNCVNPVIGATGLLEQFMGKPDTPENRASFLATIPMGRMSTPADIAAACLYLASDEAAFVTGTCIEVDGGRCV
ncbi:glucose 1-dehydrogenase [Cupriavidus gilardii]|uniref:Glucose 1-dehydrogenase n=1 Tax=Cupriavidus gilardii TaxID=82541 RepID=A0A849BD10_9BURK|nr:glucose 1-dehydrogenase [Cupriavidus gilardii]ALD92919.1 3-oxoacyl-[acyl-carrier protein] reductase [Cupriavidus gilardii CR3]KAB0597598.1 glucose 1-dehydrogenase [Cupriavidus gilardii]MCT9014593.1 glucose 1-dehydrogenase [Cupriavidus gilardii]MCT9054313.1 glucose 1-dehydrogenase [Cupriavidus gilardii]MCT9117798.1 glucose 1-dehydrogenase [Cupriavidus gilardii]